MAATFTFAGVWDMELVIAGAVVAVLGILALSVAIVLHAVDPTRATVSGELVRRGLTVRLSGSGLFAAFLTVFIIALLAVHLLAR